MSARYASSHSTSSSSFSRSWAAAACCALSCMAGADSAKYAAACKVSVPVRAPANRDVVPELPPVQSVLQPAEGLSQGLFTDGCLSLCCCL